MLHKAKGFLKSQRGVNTVEVVIILAIVVGLALLFRDQISKFVRELLNKTLDSNQF